MYTFVLTAKNSAGMGPYTEIFSVRTEEAGMLNYIVHYKVFDEMQLLLKHVTKTSHLIPAPTSPPQNVASTAVSPDSIFLAWLPPPMANWNGIIREYRINITEMETDRELYFSTAATSITVPLLHPHYTYECIISAYTIATGPSAEIVVMTHEDGM